LKTKLLKHPNKFNQEAIMAGYVGNIKEKAINNDYFREVVYTKENTANWW